MIFMHYLFIQQMIIEHLFGSGTVLDIRDTSRLNSLSLCHHVAYILVRGVR